MNEDEFRCRAETWRQRAAANIDISTRAADLRLAEEYDRLASILTGAAFTPVASNSSAPNGNPEPMRTDCLEEGNGGRDRD